MAGMILTLGLGNYFERWAQMDLAFLQIGPKWAVGGVSRVVPSAETLIAAHRRLCLDKGGPGIGIAVVIVVQI
jgi:hypothetical protein